MNRRNALTWFAIAAASGGATWFGASALSSELRSRLTPLEAALAAARANGKILLVIVAPDFPIPESPLGEFLGDVFQNLGDDMYQDFALCEVVCATRQQIRAALNVDAQADTVGLVELEGERSNWTNISLDLSPLTIGVERRTPADGAEKERAFVERAEANHNVLRAAIVPSEVVLARRADSVRRALGAEQTRAFLARLDAGETLKHEELDACAALVRTHATWPATRLPLIRAARERLLVGAPRGARWAESLGCGASQVEFLPRDSRITKHDLRRRLENLTPLAETPLTELSPLDVVDSVFDRQTINVLCGMGWTSPAGARFLLFYTDET